MTTPTKLNPGQCALCGATDLPSHDRAQDNFNHFTDHTRTLCADCKRKAAAAAKGQTPDPSPRRRVPRRRRDSHQ